MLCFGGVVVESIPDSEVGERRQERTTQRLRRPGSVFRARDRIALDCQFSQNLPLLKVFMSSPIHVVELGL